MSVTAQSIRRGFTLVELLVVISIIGILMALTLPAIQSVRESGRRTQCGNNLRNIALAFSQHEAQQKHMPTGGWGWNWGGDADGGYGRFQPGGWAYNILPFIEEAALHDLGKGMPNKSQLAEARVNTQLAIFNCPSRRRPERLSFVQTYRNIQNNSKTGVRGDYACNGGNLGWTSNFAPGNEGFVLKYAGPPAGTENKTPQQIDTLFAGEAGKIAVSNGISFIRSMLRTALIKDGLSKTYCVGERHVRVSKYEASDQPDDNQSWEAGYDWDTYRWTSEPPVFDQDGSATNLSFYFGSAHTAGLNMAFCDSTVRFIPYDIDPKVHSVLGNREDGDIFYVGGQPQKQNTAVVFE